MTIWRIVALLGVLATLGALVMLNMGTKKAVPVTVLTAVARMEPITQVVTASGKVRPETQVDLSADVGGAIRQLTVAEGDTVKAEQLLVEIDPEIYLARVKESEAAATTAQANLAEGEARLVRTRSEGRRVQELQRKDLTSRAALEQAEADLAMAEAQVDAARGRLMQAQAALAKARKDLEKCTLRAPIPGTVVTLNKELGERVSGGDFREDIIMTIADLGHMEVEVEVGERDVVLIAEENRVVIEVDAYSGEKIPGTVRTIANAGITRNEWTESEVTSFRVVVAVGATELRLRPQMSATVEIRTAHKERALTVPLQSVTMRPPEAIEPAESRKGKAGVAKAQKGHAALPRQVGDPVEVVFVVRGDKAVVTPVTTGLSSDTRIEILEGITEGVEVVSGPYRALSKDLRHRSPVRHGAPPRILPGSHGDTSG